MADRQEVEAVGPGLSASQGKQLVELHNECMRLRAELKRAERERDEANSHAAAFEALWQSAEKQARETDAALIETVDRAERAEREREGMVKLADVLAFLRAGTYYNPATGGDRAIPGWKNAADEVEREFGEASDGR